MKDISRRIFLIICAFLMLLTLCACSPVVRNTADELTLNSWQTTLDNGNIVTLEFSSDYATLTLSIKDSDTITISGLCECDDDSFIIYDEVCNIAYPFFYDVHFDCVDITYDENTLSLDKITD